MTDLPQRMREAAETLEEASVIYKATKPDQYEWNAASLRNEADFVESEIASSVESMARDLWEILHWSGCEGSRWERVQGPEREAVVKHAGFLIHRGWRKDEQ